MLVERLADSPNPQFSRPSWVNLNGTWRFAFDDDDRGIRERWFQNPERLDREIEVPYPPESELSGVNDKGFHPVLWYARELEDPRTRDGERLIVRFGSVDYHATIWVDGVQAGVHRGGHTPFELDVSDMLEPNATRHWLVVRAHDDPHDLGQPRGKQDWQLEPHVIWYHRTSGIWQPVWAEVAPPTRIVNIWWRFDPARWLIDYEIELSRAPEPGLDIEIRLEQDGDAFVTTSTTCGTRTVNGQVSLGALVGVDNPQRLLWSPDRPHLFGATVTLRGGAVDDVVESYLGLRTIDLSGRAFRLNGRPLFLRFVLNQGYWPESQLAAPLPAALKREVELIKALGFNGARTHQKIEDPRFLYWADRLGLLLWGECANAFTFSEQAIDRHADEWREAVLRDRNHPSVIAWVPFNESWGVGEVGRSAPQQQAVRAAYHRTHQLDGTRPVIGNDGWENVVGDLLTIHDYSWDPDVLRTRYGSEEALPRTLASFFPGARAIAVSGFDTSGKPVMVTEFGGVSYAPDTGHEWFGYGKVRNATEFEEQYRALVDALNESDLLCGFCYTQLTDTEQETNGLLTAGREPKIPFETAKAITQGVSSSSG